MQSDLFVRALSAINKVNAAELHQHDGVAVRLASNLECAIRVADLELAIELCEQLEAFDFTLSTDSSSETEPQLSVDRAACSCTWHSSSGRQPAVDCTVHRRERRQLEQSPRRTLIGVPSPVRVTP